MVVKDTSTDYDLIEMFSDEHDAFAREAFVKFCNKHESYIYNSCYKLVSNNQFVHDAKAEAEDLRQMVLIKILKGSVTFKKIKNIDTNEIIIHVRKWIYTIALNTFKDNCLKKQERRPELVRVDVETQDKVEYDFLKKQSIEPKLSDEQKEKYKLIIDALEDLKTSNLEEDVLRFYLESGWFDDKGSWILPPERMAEITEKHGIQRNSIIKCKGRLIEKIKNKLEN